MESGEDYSLFETRKDKGRHIRRIYAISLFVAICFIWAYRLSHIPAYGKWAWLGLFAAELWSGFYWLFGQALRWNMLFRKTFINRLSERYENSLPRVDMFVFTADPIIEPPMMVINTVLSVMAYDYPAEKLSVYLSDDAGSDITFYALLEASTFAKHWVPFCKRFKVEPRSPAAYFNTLVSTNSHDHNHAKDLDAIKKLYVDMKRRIEDVVKLGGVPSEARSKHNGFSQWDSYYSRHDHDTILQILLHERNPHNSKDVDGFVLPTLVYMAREKRPQYHHNYKAGAINSLVELHGADGYGGPLFIGTCCFHRRDALCGKKFNSQYKNEWNDENEKEVVKANLHELEVESKALASCSYEENTLWGKEIGAIYGCLVEDVITGLWIHSQGWKSIYYNPPRKAFFGIAPTNLLHTLVQQKRWGEGDFQILFTEYSPTWYGEGKINLGLLMGYWRFNYSATTCLPILYYSFIPSLYLLKAIPLFPKMSSPWFIPFAYVILGESSSTLIEGLISGGTIKGWWNDLRMWLYIRTSSYLFALIDIVWKFFGRSYSSFAVTTKIVEDDDVSQRYKNEVMEFGTSSPFFTVLATLALLHLFCLLATIKELVLCKVALTGEKMALQVLLCGFLVLINFPIYQGLFLRKDKGRLPSSHTIKSTTLALSACIFFKIWN
ncbi:cellulose synthase-like protein E1 isoform X2 [Glycine soja]|uniref:cellulose synthase-like protein E1 isoform X2 n=1 Tax=Glycine soja TaxID=3848 RepID=UPI00103BBD16|nr:cellulose synthase-like protein E1 isoform X2 [Glycine soja]